MTMRNSRLLPAALGLLSLLVVDRSAAAQPETPKALREQVLKAASARVKAEAYQKWFQEVGRAGLPELTKDTDTGIALQAAWEVHKKPAKRPQPLELRTDDVYDPAELGKFLAFLKDRTKAPVPTWWAERVVDVDLFPGRHHGFDGRGGPKLRGSKAGIVVPEGVELERREGTLTYSVGGRAVEFPADVFAPYFVDILTGLVGEKQSVVAGYVRGGGFEFSLAGFEGKGGKPTWKGEVWAAGRVLGGNAFHRAELTQAGDTVFVFGVESHGAYLEAFDIPSGECRFRFCTGYWFRFSEAWELK
ncbi:MAG TPA: hypothetical protein VKE74_14685 [Gemmataceae bacterium]|nr:hypothetical protein [Gemmataceae bacterium]